jgi:hypothetical protein
MQWSKLKKAIEGCLADSVKSRVQFHATTYGPRGGHTMSRGWITLDKEEILNLSTTMWAQEYYRLAHEIRKINRCEDFSDPNQREGYYKAYEQAEEILDKRIIYPRIYFYESLEEYLNSSIEDAMQSRNFIIKALSMFDRRLGKRRLLEMRLTPTEHPLVKKFYALRLQAEGISIPEIVSA